MDSDEGGNDWWGTLGEEKKGTYVYVILGSPSIPEKCDRNETSKEHHGRETHFGFEDIVVGFGHADYGCV